MDLREVQDVVLNQTMAMSGLTPGAILDKVRRSLWTLTCQADVVELTGVLEDFGGDKDVGRNIGKAVIGLLSLAAYFKVDAAASIERLAAEIKGCFQQDESSYPASTGPEGSDIAAGTEKPVGQSSPSSAAVCDEKNGSALPTSEEAMAPVEEGNRPAGAPADAASGPSPADMDTGKIAEYRKALAEAVADKDRVAVEKLWKTFIADKDPSLTGVRFTFQKEKNDALKQIG